MFVVYWSLEDIEGFLNPYSWEFGKDAMGDALKFMSERRLDGARFVCMSSENPDSVGKPGVDVVGPDYNWTKRRNNERVK